MMTGNFGWIPWLFGKNFYKATISFLTAAALLSALHKTLAADDAPMMSREPTDPTKKQLPGSKRQYSQAEVDDFFQVPDWYPDDHAVMPRIVSMGNRAKRVLACASCHLTSGKGHPESGNLAGLPASYLIRHLKEYKVRTHFEPSPMHEIAAGMTEAEMQEASNWFSTLKPQQSSRVEETDHVPKNAIHTRLVMRQVLPGGGTEPINGRLVEVPADAGRVMLRDPNTGFIAYVPRGSLARGKVLASGDGKRMACTACHGTELKGTASIPRLAGLSPDYVLRQLKAYRYGFRRGEQAGLMKPIVTELTVEDMLAIAAYVGSLDPAR